MSSQVKITEGQRERVRKREREREREKIKGEDGMHSNACIVHGKIQTLMQDTLNLVTYSYTG